MRPLVSTAELGGLVKDLQPAVADFAEFTDGQLDFAADPGRLQPLPARGDPADPGAAHRRRRAVDRPARTTRSSSRRWSRSSGESQNFDGNGSYVRIQAGGGQFPVQTPSVGPGGPLHSNASEQPLGTRPAKGPKPPYKPQRQVPHQPGARPERRGDRGRPVKRQIKKHAPIFVAIIVLFITVGWASPATSCRTSASTCRPGCPCSAPTSTRVNAELPTGAGGRPGSGPDGQHRRRQDRRGRVGDARGRQGRRRDADQGRVPPDLQGRHRCCCGRRPA